MSDQHKISEYIDNLQLKKSLCMGFHPDEVYEVICNLTSMYNDVLADAYEEIDGLKREVEFLRKSKGLPTSEPETSFSDEEKPEVTTYSFDDTSDEPVNYDESDEPTAEDKEEKNGKGLIDKGVQKLKRSELLEILIDTTGENEELKEKMTSLETENARLKEQLQDRKIKIEKAGTLAEAALLLNGVFDSAHAAAKQYLDNLEELSRRASETVEMKEENARKTSQQLLDETISRCNEMTSTTETKCTTMMRETQERCDALKEETESLCRKLEEDTRKKCFMLESETLRKCKEKTRKVEEYYISKTREIEEKFLMKEKEINERCAKKELDTEAYCDNIIEDAKIRAEEYWNELTERLEKFYEAHKGLRELLEITGKLPHIEFK